MLTIKKDHNLKELENYGFIKDIDVVSGMSIYKYSIEGSNLVIVESTGQIRPEYYSGVSVLGLEILYELIINGLVEKR